MSARAEHARRATADREARRHRLLLTILIIGLMTMAVFVVAHVGLQMLNNFLRHDFGLLPKCAPESSSSRSLFEGD